MARHLKVILIGLSLLASGFVNGKDRDVCEMRAEIVKRVAEQRDKGASKEALKRAISKTIPQFPAWYIDLLWQHPEMSPKTAAAKDFDLCLKTP